MSINEQQNYSGFITSSEVLQQKTGIKENKNSRKKEKDRAIIEEGELSQSRRPVNLTMEDELKVALDVLAAKRRVRPWKLLDEALREYLTRYGAL